MKWPRTLLLAGLAGACAAVSAADDAALLAPSLFVSHDSEDFLVRKTGAGFAPVYRHGNDYLAIRAARHTYASADWSMEGRQASLARTDIDARSGLGYQAMVGVSDLGARQLLTADIDHARALDAATRAGLLLQRDWVETRNALTQGVHATLFGASVERRFAPGWTAIGLLAQQRFSDENVRNHLRGRVIHDLLPDHGLNLQLRHRRFVNSREANGNYFNPDRYDETLLALGWRRRLDGWHLNATLGLGQQHVAGDPASVTRLAEVEAGSPLAGRIHLKLRAGYSNSAGLSGPDYAYRHLQAELALRF